jgi:hypothetical protein
MCDSLGKKNFNKVGLAAMIIENELKQEARSKNFAMSTALSFAIFTQAKEQARTSSLLKLKRKELEALAAEVKGPYQNWGSFSGFDSSNLSKKV